MPKKIFSLARTLWSLKQAVWGCLGWVPGRSPYLGLYCKGTWPVDTRKLGTRQAPSSATQRSRGWLLPGKWCRPSSMLCAPCSHKLSFPRHSAMGQGVLPWGSLQHTLRNTDLQALNTGNTLLPQQSYTHWTFLPHHASSLTTVLT